MIIDGEATVSEKVQDLFSELVFNRIIKYKKGGEDTMLWFMLDQLGKIALNNRSTMSNEQQGIVGDEQTKSDNDNR